MHTDSCHSEGDNVSKVLERFPHIVVEGPIGVGKTSLAEKLASVLGATLVLENAAQNPFLGRFYETSGASHALATQLYFMFQRLDQQRNEQACLAQGQRVVGDYLFEKNDVFAWLTLDKEEYALFQRIHHDVIPAEVAPPDLVIWLQAEPQTLLARIRKRATSMEKRIELPYLERLADGYAHLFQHYERAPVFAVNTENFNPIDNEAHFHGLLQRLEGFRGTRGFFNPQL